jgi:predicted alpha/beta-hydrolase family hydrolase
MEIATPHGPASVLLDVPDAASTLIVFGHGAGGGVDVPDLLAVRTAALAANVAVARVLQPYRVAGRRAPAPVGQLDTAWIAVLAALDEDPRLQGLRVVVGGRSSGARVACRTASAVRAVAVVALAFPVHPPGKPEKDRLDELLAPRVPVLVVQGSRDPFGMPPAARGRTIVTIDGADHGLKRDPAAVGAAVLTFLKRKKLLS